MKRTAKLCALFGGLLLCLNPARGQPMEVVTDRALAPSVYFGLGRSVYHNVAGNHEADAYALGLDYPLTRWFSLDLGFVDFGTAHEPRVPIWSIPTITPVSGNELHNRAIYLLPGVRWQPTSRITLRAAAGPALVHTNIRSYSVYTMDPLLGRRVIDLAESHLELFLKASFAVHLSEAWDLELSAFGTQSLARSFDYTSGQSRVSSRMESGAVTLGLRYASERWRLSDSRPGWILEVAPVWSRFSHYAYSRRHPTGFDLAVGRRLAGGFSLSLGHTEFGAANWRRRSPFPQLSPERPPHGDQAVRVNTSGTYALIGYEQAVGAKVTLGLGAGLIRTSASFSQTYFEEAVHRTTGMGQALARYDLGGGWQAKLAVRYTEFAGPSELYPFTDPVFASSKVIVWSVLPGLSLRF